ncbi:MAG: ABC transporter ATP-binding protein [Chloroflexi bacterium]|nr:ABC transporter ATP-binding protein [Chloroflexota bacterium]
MKTIKRLRILLRPYNLQITLAVLLLFSLTAIDMILPSILRQVIDVGLIEGETQFIIFAAGLVAGLGLVRALVMFGSRYTSHWLAHHVAYDLRNRLYDHIQRMSFSYHDHAQSGQLISRCIEDVRSLQNFTGHGMIELLHVLVMMIGIIIILFITNPLLAVISLLPLVPLTLMTTRFGRRIGKMFLDADNALGELSARLQENVIGVQVVRAFAREKFENERFDAANRELYKRQVRVVQEMSRVMPTSTLLVSLSTLLILWFGGNMVLQNQLSLGELVAFNTYVMMLSGPAQQLSWLINAAGETSAGLQRTFEVLDQPPEIRSRPNAVILPEIKGEVAFENVSFHYHGEKIPALHEINLNVKPNQLIALVGPTGSGKTSLINLIPRFYDVTKGRVTIDGVDVRDLNLKNLRSQIGIVLQTSLLFSSTIRENIAYGRPDATMDEIIAAAKAAQAHDFIMEMPQQYETKVGERGVTLSGGQRQRVAIARALVMNPRILIMDDSTSSVDTQTEILIQNALNHLMRGRTTFVIAQRLSTVRSADLILVMDKGRIVQRGKHQELLNQPGLYREIYDMQLRDQERFQEEMEQLQTQKNGSQFAQKRS